MKVFVVLYQQYTTMETDVLDVYTNEEEANRRVAYERSLIESSPYNRFRDECWYTDHEVI